jgi:hypothetical protein
MKLLLTAFIFLTATPAFADGYCTAADPGDHFYRSTCGNKNEQLCKWDDNCRWAYSSSGSCEARDSSDHFYRSTCGNKNEQLCKWDNNCVWND